MTGEVNSRSPRRNEKITTRQEDIEYDYEDFEENLIKFFIEKVIVMREVPLMKAAQLLERENNMKKIAEKL